MRLKKKKKKRTVSCSTNVKQILRKILGKKKEHWNSVPERLSAQSRSENKIFSLVPRTSSATEGRTRILRQTQQKKIAFSKERGKCNSKP